MTHALAAWTSGAKVLGFSVGSRAGHVDVSRSNTWIALAPYVVPFYAVGVAFAYRLLQWGASPSILLSPSSRWIFLLAMGVALAFHVVETAEALWGHHQPDLDDAGGVVFSMAVIILANAVLLIVVLKCLFPGAVSARASFDMIRTLTFRCWSIVLSAARHCLHPLLSWFARSKP